MLYSRGLLTMNSYNFYLSENFFILPSILWDIFSGYRFIGDGIIFFLLQFKGIIPFSSGLHYF